MKQSFSKFKWLKWVLIAIVAAALIFAAIKLLGGAGSNKTQTAQTDFVTYGSITSKVEGSGLTKAKNSETLTLTTAGNVLDVFVTEGQLVEEGDLLFTIESKSAEAAVQKAKSNYEGTLALLNTAKRDLAGLNLAASYPGKLMNCTLLMPGDTVSKGQVLARLNDDTNMRLQQYYSYAYEGELSEGQQVDVSIPQLMTSTQGYIESIHYVSRIEDGSLFFSADIIVPNPGVLTEGLSASATVKIGNETVYPFEAAPLTYYRTGNLVSTVNGTVINSKLYDYLQVKQGDVLVTIDGDDSTSEIFTLEQALEEAQKELDAAEKNLGYCNAVAPISGKIIGLSVMTGQEIPANSTLCQISDTSSIIVNATVDERNISYIKQGMGVELDQWGIAGYGIVESVSYNSTISNGVATYPIVISADNAGGQIQVNSYINYNLTASQSDNCLIVPVQAVRSVTTAEGETVNAVYVKASSAPDNALELEYTDPDIPSGFYPVRVEIGIQDNYNVEIKSGLDADTEVFIQMVSDSYWG